MYCCVRKPREGDWTPPHQKMMVTTWKETNFNYVGGLENIWGGMQFKINKFKDTLMNSLALNLHLPYGYAPMRKAF